VRLVRLGMGVLDMWLLEMLCMGFVMVGLVVVYVVQLRTWVLMVQVGVVVWMIRRVWGMRKSFCRVRRMRMVWVELLQLRMKWDEGRGENVRRWRVCLLMGRMGKRMRNVANLVSK
jgi:hypothetical protein